MTPTKMTSCISRVSLRSFSALLALTLILTGSVEAEQNPHHYISESKNSLTSINKQKLNFKNWGLFNKDLSESHINAPAAWKIQKGTKSIVVAVIDTGIDPNHPDLKDNLWKSPVDPSAYGKNFVENNGKPNDVHGHGTHVAGIIGATINQKAGLAGVAPNVTIMPIKYYAPSLGGAGTLANTIKAFNWAIENGAHIINYSGGGPSFSKPEFDAIMKAREKGILVVAAAGNEGSNIDQINNAYYPASYGLDNIITVAAIDIKNQLIPSSNYGAGKVHVAAPGDNIFSSYPGKGYSMMTGTSQATAFVSGLAALLLSQDPSLTPKDIKEIIMTSTDSTPSLRGGAQKTWKVASGGKINAYKALVNTVKRPRRVSGPKVASYDKPKILNSALSEALNDFSRISAAIK